MKCTHTITHNQVRNTFKRHCILCANHTN